MNRILIKIHIVLFSLVVLCLDINGQDNTMYMLHQLPQANMLNPSVDFPCKFYIELPVISSIKVAYNNTSFSYKDFIRQGTGSRADSLILDFDNIYPLLRRNNAIYAEVENVLVGTGFHWRKKYLITARIYHSHQAGAFYNKELVSLKDGNWNPATDSPVNFDLSRNEANDISYLAFSVGISKRYTSQLRLGASLSYLKGILNYNTKKTDLKITTTEQPLTVDIKTAYNSNISLPMEIVHDASGRIQSFTPVTDNILGDYILNKNRGVKLDFGMVYEVSDKTIFSASILNLGFIRWKSNSYNFNAKGSLSLTGVDLVQYSNNQSTDLIYLLRDTLVQSLQPKDSPIKYFTPLPVKLIAGTTHQIGKNTKIGLVGKLFVFNYATFPSLTATLNWKPTSFIDLTGSVSYANRTLRNIGFAAVFGNEPVNFYIASDMMPINYVQETQSAMIFPYQSRSFSLRFGLNLMFGCKTYKKPKMPPSCPAYKL